MARSAHAEQFVLFDATIDYTWDQAVNSKPSKSHFYVNEGNFLNKERPENWLSPVDYRNGTLHVRTEVLEKPPGDQQVGWTLCYIPNSGGYGCADTTYYESTGVFDRETSMTDWWQNEELNWEQGVKQMDLIYAIDDSGSGHVSNYPDLKDKTTPTRVRITMVQVSAGSTYDDSMFDSPSGGTGGAAGMGGATTSGGGAGANGGGGFGGVPATGGASASGAAGASPVSSSGSATVTGGASAAGAGGSGFVPAQPSQPKADGGCTLTASPTASTGAWSLGLLALLVGSRRRGRKRR